jgi:hypothetical protein
MNRVWLCLPRNISGMHQLRLYEQESRFKFDPRRPDAQSKIWWRASSSPSEYIQVKSPLAEYLHQQRSQNPGGPWSPEHASIIAKDYAVLARFTDRRGRTPTIEGSLKDYFLAGIRGLGTWGAGWFIDRRYNSFLPFEHQEDDPIQMLLEVTYIDEQIHDVCDVSDKPQSYFENESNPDTIRRCIQQYRQR